MKIDKQLEKIFEEVIKLLYKKAKSTHTVVEYLKKRYDLGNSRSYEIIREAKIYFGKFIMDTDVEALTDCIEILKENREKAADINNLKEVRECTKEIGKLQQLYIHKIELDDKRDIPMFGDLKKDDDKNNG